MIIWRIFSLGLSWKKSLLLLFYTSLIWFWPKFSNNSNANKKFCTLQILYSTNRVLLIVYSWNCISTNCLYSTKSYAASVMWSSFLWLVQLRHKSHINCIVTKVMVASQDFTTYSTLLYASIALYSIVLKTNSNYKLILIWQESQ